MKRIPDLWENCYDGDHRKLLAPEQFRQMFCNVCLNQGCSNSKGTGSKWSRRMSTQEDRLLKNPMFAGSNAADAMGLPDFKDMMREALAIEISSKRNDWEVVTEAEVGRAAAELLGMPGPSGFKSEPNPIAEPVRQEQAQEPSPPEHSKDLQGKWRVRGDSKDETGKIRTYEVTLDEDGVWDCTCPSRENPCKHTRYIQGRLEGIPEETRKAEVKDPVIPEPAPRSGPPKGFNTTVPQGGIMVGMGDPEPKQVPSQDAWSVPDLGKPKERVIEVGARVTFGSGNKR